MNEKLIELEKKYNWYAHKVIEIPEGARFIDVKIAILAYVKKHESLSNQDLGRYSVNLKDLNNDNVGLDLNISKFDLDNLGNIRKISVTQVEPGYALVKISNFNWDNIYLKNIYVYIENYLKNVSQNRCPKCGEPIIGKGNFCTNCGAPL